MFSKVGSFVSTKGGKPTKDIPLRKSDRKELLQHAIRLCSVNHDVNSAFRGPDPSHIATTAATAIATETTTTTTTTAPPCSVTPTLNQKMRVDTDHCVSVEENQSAAAQPWHSLPSQHVGNMIMDHNIPSNVPPTATPTAILESAFLLGNLYTRSILLSKGHKVKLYLRSPTTMDEFHRHHNDYTSINYIISVDNNKSCATPESVHWLWPYFYATQCIWIQIEMMGEKHYHDIPGLALLAVLFGSTPQLLPSDDSTHDTNDIKQTSSLLSWSFPTLIIAAPASKNLCRGADVMRPGIIRDDHNHAVIQNVTQCSVDQRYVAIAVQGNPQPFAVGLLASTIQSLSDVGPGSHGVAVFIITCYGDDIWQSQFPSPKNGTISKGHRSNECSLSAWGGTCYDDGHYGNIGFINGQYVVPISTAAVENNRKEEESIQMKLESVNENARVHDSLVPTELENVNDRHSNNELDDNSDLDHSPDDIANLSILEDNDKNLSQEEVQRDTIHPTQWTPDEVLHAAVCRALFNMHLKRDFPILVSQFYASHVIPHRVPGTTIELKKTSYKKLGPYVQAQVKNGLLFTRPDSTTKEPHAILTGYDPHHLDLQSCIMDMKNDETPMKSVNNNESDGVHDDHHRLILIDLFVIPQRIVSLLQLNMDQVKAMDATSIERRGSGLLTVKEIRNILDDYITSEELIDASQPKNIILNGPLTDVLFPVSTKHQKSSSVLLQQPSPPSEVMTRQNVATLWQSKMEKAYAVVTVPGSTMVKLGRGDPPMITIDVSRRQSKKYITRVRGLEEYNISPSIFCKDVSARLACSGIIDDDPTTSGREAVRKKGYVELVFTGNLSLEIEAYLLGDERLSSHGGIKKSEYHVPKNSIQVVLRKGVPSRK
jgi:translation initiation factor 2D